MKADSANQAHAWVLLEDHGAQGAALRQALAAQKAMVAADFAKQGREVWCRSAWELFGPRGLRTIKRAGD